MKKLIVAVAVIGLFYFATWFCHFQLLDCFDVLLHEAALEELVGVERREAAALFCQL